MKESKRHLQIRKGTDKLLSGSFALAGLLSALFLALILIFVFHRGIRVFLPGYVYGREDLLHFLSGLSWRPEQDEYGVLFIVLNTLNTAFFAVVLSFPISTMTAVFVVRHCNKKLASAMTTVIELLAAIPSVVYGVFASGWITHGVMGLASLFGISTYAGNSNLTVIFLLAIMIYPTMAALSIAALKAVPKPLSDASLALGASPVQTEWKVLVPAAKSGIFAGLILGLGRAFGEATAVSMVAGNKLFGPSFNPFDITRTLTSTMLSGLKETSGKDYDIRFSVGMVLMVLILLSNLMIHLVKKRIGHDKALPKKRGKA